MESQNNSDSRATAEPGGLSNWLVVFVICGIAAVLVIRASQPRAEYRSMPLPPLNVAGWINTDEPVTNDQLRGRVVLVDCWASWCGPCIRNMPELVKFYHQFHDEGLTVVGLTPESTDELPGVERYVQSVRGLDWPIAYGAHMPIGMLGDPGYPTYILFDRSGQSVWSGHSIVGLDDAVIAALAEGA